MTEYVRVNVSTATSPPGVEDVAGNVIGEINMQLPANIIGSADQIATARMAVMKANIPLTNIPQIRVELREYNGNYIETNFIVGFTTQRVLRTKAEIGLLVKYQNAFSGEYVDYPSSGSGISNSQYLSSSVYHFATTPQEAEEASKKGYFEYKNIQEFLNDISYTVDLLLKRIMDGVSITPTAANTFAYPTQPFTCSFIMNADSTCSIKIIQLTTDPEIIFAIKPFAPTANSEWSNTHLLATTFKSDVGYTDTTEVVRPQGAAIEVVGDRLRPSSYYGPIQIFLGVNEYLKEKLPSLPWAYPVQATFSQWSSLYPAFTEDHRFFILETQNAKIDFTPNALTTLYKSDDEFGDTILPREHAEITYHFLGSDMLQTNDVTSIILTMNGGAFNPQVFPVNFAPTTVQAAQVQTIPIIDVYYPLWSTPVDLSSNLVVVRNAFEDAAPIKINPSLLKERSIKFKLYYITKDGRMHELFIPKGTPFTFQLCFELEPRYPHA